MSKIMQDYILPNEEKGNDLLDQVERMQNLSLDCEWWQSLDNNETEIKRQEGVLRWEP